MIGWLRQAGHGHLLENQHGYANFPSSAPPLSPSSPPPPVISAGYSNTNPYGDLYNRAASFSPNINTQSYGGQHSPTNFISSPSQFIAPNMNPQIDMDIEVSLDNFPIIFN
jgi:hypothetical protein